MIQILDKKFEIFIPRQEINEKIKELGNAINSKFHNQEVVFLSVLNGSFMFSSDLMKTINLDCEISFVKMKSYRGTSSTGNVDELIGLGKNLEGKQVVILEDIIDSGLTIDKIIKLIEDQNPANILSCTLLFKPDAFQGLNKPDLVGFNIPNAFVVGYGLDYDEKGRNLDAIYQIKE